MNSAKPNIKLSNLEQKFNENLAFELRTLLNGFSGPVQLLKHRVDDPKLVDIFRIFDSTLSRLERLALRISIIQRLEDESFIFEKRPVNIVDIANYSKLEMQSLSDLENINITINSIGENNEIEGNFDLLIQVFHVLFETIITLSSQDSNIEVEFSTASSQLHCVMHSPSATLPKEIENETTQSINHEIVSWELMLVKRILQLHNAQISVAEKENNPNAFEIRFNTN